MFPTSAAERIKMKYEGDKKTKEPLVFSRFLNRTLLDDYISVRYTNLFNFNIFYENVYDRYEIINIPRFYNFFNTDRFRRRIICTQEEQGPIELENIHIVEKPFRLPKPSVPKIEKPRKCHRPLPSKAVPQNHRKNSRRTSTHGRSFFSK